MVVMKKLKICWVSAGISSFMAGYLAGDVDEWIYIDIADQQEDSIRFIKDCEKAIGKKIQVLKSSQYRCVEDCVRTFGGFRNSVNGFAPCTNWLKKRVRKESNKLPDILDYALSDSLNENVINSYEFDSLFKLDWGRNEGIYLDVAITGCFDGESKVISLGTFKTLLETDEAMHQMAALEADFVIILNRFVEKNLDDFTWSGYDLIPLDSNGKRCKNRCGYEIHDKTKIMERVKGMFQGTCEKVCVLNNATKEKTYYVLNEYKEVTESEACKCQKN